MIPNPRKLWELKRKADEAKKILEAEVIEIQKDGIHIKIRGDEKILLLEVDGIEDKRLSSVLSDALKEVKKVQMKKMQGFMGDFGLS